MELYYFLFIPRPQGFAFMCSLGYNINQFKGVWVMNNNFINALQNILLDSSNKNFNFLMII